VGYHNHNVQLGHRVMVQVQSRLFPLYDRNPQNRPACNCDRQAARAAACRPGGSTSMIGDAQSVHIQNQRHTAIADQSGAGVAG